MPIDFPGDAPSTAAVPAKTFPHAFVREIIINARSNGPDDTLYAEIVPYNGTTGEMLPEQAIEIRVPLLDAVAALPELQTARAAILAAVSAIVAYQDALNAPPDPEEA